MKHRDRLIASVSVMAITLIAPPASATHRHFEEPGRNWTGGPFVGNVQTSFADVDGDGKADAIAVDSDRIRVRLSDGCKFGPEEVWLSTAPWPRNNVYYGADFADVDGDGKADFIVTTSSGVKVRRSVFNPRLQRNEFGPMENGTSEFYSNSWGPYLFADVDGDGKADAIAVTSAGVVVRRSMWDTKLGNQGFGSPEMWTDGPYYGEITTQFADVDGDGKADAIIVNPTGIMVALSGFKQQYDFRLGKFVDVPSFYPPNIWTKGPYPSFLGGRGNFFASVLGTFGDRPPPDRPFSRRADAIVVNGDGIAVRESFYYGFLSPDPNDLNKIRVGGDEPLRPWGYWTNGAFYGVYGTFFADVNGDGRADAIAVKDDGVWVGRSIPDWIPSSECPP